MLKNVLEPRGMWKVMCRRALMQNSKRYRRFQGTFPNINYTQITIDHILQ